MSVSGAMYTGISGMKAQSEATSVVSNNLANSTTTAFKSSSVQFEDVFYSTVYAGGSVDQVGHGVTTASIDTDFSQGSYESTNEATDLALNGNGYFIVVDPDNGNTYYTRAGNFDFNEEGFLVDAHGNVVQGWQMSDGSATGSLTDVMLDSSQSPPNPTSEITLSLNLDASSDNYSEATNQYTALFNNYDGTDDPALDESRYSYSTTMTIYDENGTSHDLTVYLDPVGEDDDGDMVWEYVVACDPDEDQRTDLEGTSGAGLLMTGTLTFSSSGQLTNMTAFTYSDSPSVAGDPTNEANWELAEFDDSGYPIMNVNFTGSSTDQEITMNFGLTNKDVSGTGWDTSGGIDSLDDITSTTDADDLPTFNSSSLGVSATTCYSDSSSATYSKYQDGYATGTLLNVEVNENGVLYGIYSNGVESALFQVAVADFTNEEGLNAEGSNLFSATTESGQPVIGTAGSASFGTIASNTLEGSNVDTATEMTNLIIIQSAYQANSKVITTADDMIQIAVGLKS